MNRKTNKVCRDCGKVFNPLFFDTEQYCIECDAERLKMAILRENCPELFEKKNKTTGDNNELER